MSESNDSEDSEVNDSEDSEVNDSEDSEVNDSEDGAPRKKGKRRRGRDYIESLRGDLQDLQGPLALISELIQNADDAEATRVRFTITDEALTVWNSASFSTCDDVNSDPCSKTKECDFHSFSEVASATKRERRDTTGAFGVGFTAVYQITDRPVLESAGWRWVIDEMLSEENRIDYEELPNNTDGTTFTFPWARVEDTAMRVALGQRPVTDKEINALRTILSDWPAELLLFLRHLREIEVVDRGVKSTYSRPEDDDRVRTIKCHDGTRRWTRRWYMISSSFSEIAQQIVIDEDHIIPKDRYTEVNIAIALDHPTDTGRYFVTLPTETLTGLPVSVNGSFFPKKDRKSILVDSNPRGEWNRAIIECAVQAVSTNLEASTKKAGDDWILQLLKAAAELGEKSAGAATAWDPAKLWRDPLWAKLPSAEVVRTHSGQRRTISTALVWADPEGAAASTLEKLDVHLVHPDVRAEWYGLRSSKVDIKPLSLTNVTDAITRLHDNDLFADSGLDANDREALWSLINHLLSSQPSNTSLSTLDQVALYPLRTGDHGSVLDSFRAEEDSLAMIDSAGLTPRLVNPHFEKAYPRLAGRVRSVDVKTVVTWFSDAFGAGTVLPSFDRFDLLDWIAKRSTESLQLDRTRLAALPIYPTGSGYSPLRDEVVLPAPGFDEPLRLASVISLRGRADHVAAFLKDLNVPQLGVEVYCAKLLSNEVIDELDDQRALDLLDFLRTNLSRIEQNDEVRQNLASLRVIPCSDDVRRKGEEVYFNSVDTLVVGAAPPRVRPDIDTRQYAALLAWLGVTDKARPKDVLAQCDALRRRPHNHRAIAEAVLGHLTSVGEAEFERRYKTLKSVKWLPVQDEPGKSARPVEVYTPFMSEIFSSQADFLGVNPDVADKSRDALKWLEVKTKPRLEMVIKHLLHLATNGARVTPRIWSFLSENIEASELNRLESIKCVPLPGGKFVLPRHTFLDSPPFGAYRYTLPDRLSQWKDLFTRIGVREQPSAQDGVEVLGEIASRHGGAEASVVPSDREAVLGTWVFLNDLLRRDEAAPADLADLSNVECVLDCRDRLRMPKDVLFGDSSTIRRYFDVDAATRLIERPENMVLALQAAGVRSLRDVVTTELCEEVPRSEPSSFEALVEARRRFLIMVLQRFMDDPAAVLNRFKDEATVSPMSELVVVERVKFGNPPIESKALPRSALWRREENRLLLIEPVTGREWSEVAKEFAIALAAFGGGDPDAVYFAVLVTLSAPTNEDCAAAIGPLALPEISGPVVVNQGETTQTPADDGWEGEDTPDESPPGPSDEPVSKVSHLEGDSGGGTKDPTTSLNNPSVIPEKTPPAGPEVKPTTEAPSKPKGEPRPTDREPVQQRLRSYVIHGTTDGPRDPAAAQRRNEIEREAIEFVIDYERRAGREPVEMERQNPGYDIESEDKDGRLRYIEVKGTNNEWTLQGVGLTAREFKEARERESNYWLYVVEVGQGQGRAIYRIQDPAGQVDEYRLDHGWKTVAVPNEETPTPLPPIPNTLDSDDGSSAVKILDSTTGLPTGKWIRIPEDAELSGPREKCFAIQIAGNACGMGMRGGVAFFTETTAADLDDFVVVELLGPVDPDTNTSFCIRNWKPDTSLDLTRQPIRLYAENGLVPPISVEDQSKIRVLGKVFHLSLPQT